MRLSKVFTSGVAGLALLAVAAPQAVAAHDGAADDNITRIAGADRFETNQTLAQILPAQTGGVVFLVAPSAAETDALTAAVKAAHYSTPVLLLRGGGLSEGVRAQLERLAPSKLVVVGRTPDTATMQALGAIAPVRSVVTASRVQTSVALATTDILRDLEAAQAAESATTQAGTGDAATVEEAQSGDSQSLTSAAPSSQTDAEEDTAVKASAVYLANARSQADILTAGVAAAREGAELLLTEPTYLSPATAVALGTLGPQKVTVVGGSAAVSDAVLQAAAKASGAPVTRLAGANRFETAAKVAALHPAKKVYYANAYASSDALSVVPVVAYEGANLLLVRQNCAPVSTLETTQNLAPSESVLVGGEKAVSNEALENRCPTTEEIAAAAAKAAAERAAAEAAAAQARAAAAAANRTPQQIASNLLGAYGWNQAQMGCLINLWNLESGWRVNAGRVNGPYGIPQANPGYKMASAGADWRTNPETQIRWGLSYIKGRYGSPCGAWGNFTSRGWY